MSRLLTLLIIISFLLPGIGWAQDEHYSMSLKEAVEYGLAHNQNILNAKLEIDYAEGLVKENIAVGLPQVNGSIDIADNFALPVSFIPAEFVGGTPGETVTTTFGTKYSGNASIAATQMVFDGVFFVGLEAAKTFQELSTKEHIKTKIDVSEAVTKAYYNVLVNRLTLELIEKNYGRLDTLLTETKAMQASGFAERIDVSRVQLQFNNIRVNQNNSKKLLTIAESMLKYQMGMPISSEITLTDELGMEMFDDAVTEEFKYDQRVEYSIMQTQERLAILDIKRTKVGYLPKLDLYANIGAVAGTGAGASLFNIGNNWFSYGLVGLKLNIPIFDGLQKHRSVQQKEAKLDQVYNSFELLKNGIDLEIEQTRIAYTNNVDFMNVQLENVDISEDVYNVTKTKYQQGVGSNIEVINADADYKEAQTNFFNALYQALIAKVDYDKALGKLN